jgi:hypothetical protein
VTTLSLRRGLAALQGRSICDAKKNKNAVFSSGRKINGIEVQKSAYAPSILGSFGRYGSGSRRRGAGFGAIVWSH